MKSQLMIIAVLFYAFYLHSEANPYTAAAPHQPARPIVSITINSQPQSHSNIEHVGQQQADHRPKSSTITRAAGQQSAEERTQTDDTNLLSNFSKFYVSCIWSVPTILYCVCSEILKR